MLKIRDLMLLDIFKKYRLITKDVGLDNLVQSVMVLESDDIEKWGKKNQLILTSYYALSNSNSEDLKLFFKKSKSIGISGIVLKTNRLVQAPPQNMIDLCLENEIALIEIDDNLNYDDIWLTIYKYIENHQSFLLRTYYDSNLVFANLDKSADYKTIMGEYYKLINKSCQLIIPNEDINISYGGIFDSPYSIEKTCLISNEFTRNDYYRQTIHLLETDQVLNIIHIEVKRDPIFDCQINILEKALKNNSLMLDIDIMIAENLINFIQTKFQLDHLLKKEKFIHLNNIASKLLFNLTDGVEELNALLTESQMDKFPFYQALCISYKSQQELNYFKNKFASENIPYIFYTQKTYLLFVLNIENAGNKAISKKRIIDLFPANVNNNFYITSCVSKFDIHDLFGQCSDMINFNTNFKIGNIIEINDLGVFRLLIKYKKSDLLEIIPDKLIKLKQNHTELYNTLETFLNNNQNYKRTANQMYLHPKTIRYRINKIKDLIELDFDDSSNILNLLNSLFLLKILEHKNN